MLSNSNKHTYNENKRVLPLSIHTPDKPRDNQLYSSFEVPTIFYADMLLRHLFFAMHYCNQIIKNNTQAHMFN